MANLLTKKVMDNMARQYRKENGMSSSTSSQQESVGNINPTEESLLLGVIKNNLTQKSGGYTREQNYQGVKKLNLEDLVGHSKQSAHKITRSSSAITLDELASKHSK
jgi:hypothetical protein